MLSRIGHGTAAQAFGLLVALFDRLILVGILIRVWGAELYADWAVMLATAGLLSLGELSINIYFGNVWQSAYAKHDTETFSRILAVALSVYGVLSLCLLSFVVLLLGGIGIDPAHALGLRVLDGQSSAIALSLLAVTTIARINRGLLISLYRGHGRFARGTVLDSLAMAAASASAIGGVILGAGAVELAAIYLVAELCAGWLSMLADSRRCFPRLRFSPALPTRGELIALARQLRWLAFIQGGQIVWLNLPVIALGSLTADTQGIVSFVLLRTLVNFARQLVAMPSNAAGVELAHLVHTSERAVTDHYVMAFGRLLCMLAALISAGLYVFTAPLVHLWTGHSELANPAILICLIAALLAATPSMPLSSLAMLSGRPRGIAIAAMIQVACGFTLGGLAARFYGVAGFVAGLAFGEVLAQGLILPKLAAPELARTVWPRYLAICAWRMLIGGGWSAAWGLAIASVMGTDTIARFITAGILWGLIGAAPPFFLSLSPDYRERLLRLPRKAIAAT